MFEATTRGLFACTLCKTGKTTLGLNGSAACTRSCGPGSYISGTGTCAWCAQGLYQEGTNKEACKNCPTGYDQPDGSQAFCRRCIPGKRAITPGNPLCNLCAIGRFTKELNQSVPCNNCPLGFYQPKQSQVAW